MGDLHNFSWYITALNILKDHLDIIVEGSINTIRIVSEDLSNELNKAFELIENLGEAGSGHDRSNYYTILQNVNDGVIIHREDKILYSNKAMSKTTGYTPEELKDMNFLNLFVPQQKDTIMAEDIDHSEQRGSESVTETRILTKDGLIKDVELSYDLISYEGQPSIICTIRDVTSFKRMERTLRWELAVNIVISKISKTLLLKSSEIEDIAEMVLVYAKILTESRSGSITHPDSDKRDFGRYILPDSMKKRSFYNNSPESSEIRVTPDGKDTNIKNLLSVPIIDGGVHRGRITLSDSENEYTDRDLSAVKRLAEFYSICVRHKRADRKIKESEERYHTLFDSSPDAIAQIEGDEGTFLTMNATMAKNFSKYSNELIGKRISDLMSVNVAGQRMQMIQKALGHNRVMTFEDEIEGRYFLNIVVPLSTEKPKKTVQFVSRDITARKSAEEELRRSKEELQKAYEELKGMDKMKTEFAAIATHEIGTPLSIISANVELLNEGLFGEITEEQRERLNIIFKNVGYLIKLNKEMMDISRIDSGKLKLNKGPCLLNGLIRETVQEMEPLAMDKNLRITVENPENPIIVICDQERIRQVLSNLLNNAIKFTPPTREIAINVEDRNVCVVVAVSDEGIGIPQEEHEKIFDRFYEIGGYLEHETGGAGLGLAIVRGIVWAHGGKVWIDSEVGRGSTFYFSLPKKGGV